MGSPTGMMKRRRAMDEFEEPRSVLDIGGCISPPMEVCMAKKMKSDEDFDDLWTPLDSLDDLQPSLGLDRSDFLTWQPEILLSPSEDEFEVPQFPVIMPEDSWSSSSDYSCSSSPDDSFMQLPEVLPHSMQHEDVLLDKIELDELINATFWNESDFFEQQQEHINLQENSVKEPIFCPPQQEARDASTGLRLVQLLLGCAEAVACRDVNQAAAYLGQLQLMASPQGDSMQRVTSCFVEGLTARLAGLQSLSLNGVTKPAMAPPAARRILLPDVLRDEGYRLTYEFCPYLSFGHFVSNAAILEAFENESHVHIVDLGMSNALQWPALLQGLASRPGGPPKSIRLTGVGSDSQKSLMSAGEELESLASSLGLGFEFRAVTQAVESLQKGMLDIREGEAMAVNSVFQLHCVVKESRRSLKSVLQSIHDLNPKILTLVEQDACHNGPFFLGRFMEALHYYSAIFDGVDSILPADSHERIKIEQYHFAEEIKNIVACEGPDRVERHERADQWRRRMSRAGFQPKPLKFLTEAKTWLNMYYPNEGYTLVEEKGCIVLGWKGKPIVATSTWRC